MQWSILLVVLNLIVKPEGCCVSLTSYEQFLTMSELESLLKLGQTMGLKGESLAKFVTSENERRAQERKDEREHRLKQRQLDREAIEKESEKEELEMRKIDMLMKLEEMKKENADNVSYHHSGSSTPAYVRPRTPKLPSFNENKDDMDSYLHRFERYANVQGWDRDNEWAINLSTLLTGKALDVYSSLDDIDADDYDILKEAILKRYELTEEGFRLKFRNAKPEDSETPSQYTTRMWNYLNRWVELSSCKKEYADLIDLLLREQFIKSVNKDLAIFLKERKPHDASEMAKFAEISRFST